MRIEKLLPPPQPGKPWSVALEGGEVLRVSESVVASFALYGGMELEAETLTALQEAAALAAWREKAGRLLTARMLSSGQLAEGDLLLTQPAGILPGAPVTLAPAEGSGL